MQLQAILLATFAALSIAAPGPDVSNSMLTRAIDYSAFSEAELADQNVESCCCCKPPSQITNVATLHRIVEAQQAKKAKRGIDYSFFTEAELKNKNPTSCCCCKPPNQISDVAVLHRLIAATQ